MLASPTEGKLWCFIKGRFRIYIWQLVHVFMHLCFFLQAKVHHPLMLASSTEGKLWCFIKWRFFIYSGQLISSTTDWSYIPIMSCMNHVPSTQMDSCNDLATWTSCMLNYFLLQAMIVLSVLSCFSFLIVASVYLKEQKKYLCWYMINKIQGTSNFMVPFFLVDQFVPTMPPNWLLFSCHHRPVCS